jgi:hypothetical protein
METIWMEHPIEYERYPRCLPGAVTQDPGTRRRRFWCAEAGREVEVLFEERGLPGMRWSAAVKSCPVFEPGTGIACHRHCLSATFRRQWKFALPVRMKAGES